MKMLLTISASVLLSLWIAGAGAQEKAIVGHSARAKPVSQSEVVDYSFLRAALKK